MAKLHMDDIAEGGVLGAKQYFPGFDISGSVLLDLSAGQLLTAVENRELMELVDNGDA